MSGRTQVRRLPLGRARPPGTISTTTTGDIAGPPLPPQPRGGGGLCVRGDRPLGGSEPNPTANLSPRLSPSAPLGGADSAAAGAALGEGGTRRRAPSRTNDGSSPLAKKKHRRTGVSWQQAGAELPPPSSTSLERAKVRAHAGLVFALRIDERTACSKRV